MKRLVLCVCLFSALNGLADEWLRTVKITIDPPDNGQHILNLRFVPNKTVEYDMLAFECVYRQSIPWQDEQGRSTFKLLEPMLFVYRRPNVKFVADLDFNVSFRVPISHARLAEAFGADTFKTNYPIIINRLRISAERGESRLWEQELQVPGTYEIKTRAPKPPPPPPPKNGKFGEVNLD